MCVCLRIDGWAVLVGARSTLGGIVHFAYRVGVVLLSRWLLRLVLSTWHGRLCVRGCCVAGACIIVVGVIVGVGNWLGVGVEMMPQC